MLQSSTKFGMEINADKTKIMTNNGQKLETVNGNKTTSNTSVPSFVTRIPEEKCSPELLKQWQHLLDKPHLEKQEHQNKIQNKTNARPGHNNIPLIMWDLDTHSRTSEENPVARV